MHLTLIEENREDFTEGITLKQDLRKEGKSREVTEEKQGATTKEQHEQRQQHGKGYGGIKVSGLWRPGNSPQDLQVGSGAAERTEARLGKVLNYTSGGLD